MVAALTWGQVSGWRAAPLVGSEKALKSRRDGLLSYADELALMGTPKRWTGQAADAAGTARRGIADAAEGLTSQVGAAFRAMCDAGDAVAGVEQAVRDVEWFATANGLRISAAGVVSDVSWAELCFASVHDEEIARAERQARVDECAARVAAVVIKAADVDADLCAVMAGILGGAFTGAGVTSLAQAAADGEARGGSSVVEPPKGAGTAAENAAWWASLSAKERERVIKEHPGWIGNRDGVDFAARDQANRALLPRYREELEKQKAELEAKLADYVRKAGRQVHPMYAIQLSQVEDKLASLDTIERLMKKPDRHLLGLDITHDRAEAVVAVGDVTTAEHVGVFTPGLTSTVQGMGGYDTDMYELKRRSEKFLRQNKEAASAATVTWLGYQAPQWGSTLTSNSVALPGAATEGGGALAEFLRGVNTSRVDDPDLSVLGHSYGSTTAGHALQQDTGVDRAAFFGSPGLGTSDLGDLKVPSGQSFYAEAKLDPVGDMPRFGQDPSFLGGMRHLQTGDATSPDGEPLTGVTGHSRYLEDKSTSQYNLASVVAGRPDQLVEGRDIGVVEGLRTVAQWLS